MTYNKQKTSWNNPQPDTTSNNPNLPTSKKKALNNQQQADFEIILQYGAISSLLSTSLTRFQPNMWLQSFEHCFTEYHNSWNIQSFKVITLFSAHHTEKQLNTDYTLFLKLNWKIFKFVAVINFLHVNQSLSILQCMWNRSLVFQIKLLKHLLVKSCGITKYFRLLLCNLQGLSAVEIFLALLLFLLKF